MCILHALRNLTTCTCNSYHDHLDRAEDMEVVRNAVQSHLSQLIGHHHGNPIKETVQVLQGDLFPSVSLKEDVLYLRQPPAEEERERERVQEN